MFDVGTKIILIESSHQKTIGPRKGSIGYVSDCRDIRALEDIGAVAAICEVFFIRYGFEKSNRIEKRYIIPLIPIIKKDDHANANKQIKILRSKLISSKHSSMLDFIRSKYGTISVPVVMAAPVYQNDVDLTTCDKLEFKAWLESYLSNRKFADFINLSLQSKHYTNYADTVLQTHDVWEMIINAMADRPIKDRFIDKWSTYPDWRKTCVGFLRPIIVNHIMNSTKSTISDNFRFLHGDLNNMAPSRVRKEIYEVFCKNVFNKVMSRSFIKECRDRGRKDLSSMVDDFELIIQVFSGLSARVMGGSG